MHLVGASKIRLKTGEHGEMDTKFTLVLMLISGFKTHPKSRNTECSSR